MHRILNAKNLYPNTFHNLASSSNNIVKGAFTSEQKCFFCHEILQNHGTKGNLFQTRHQSTRTLNALQKSTKKKVKYKNYKKYGEVMEVSNKTMKEAKVSISKLNASYLAKIASSHVSLGQLHQLTRTKSNPSIISEVDPEILKNFKEKVLKRNSTEVHLEDDQYTLIFTNNTLTNVENNFLTQSKELIRNSYLNFRKATLYSQKLNDLRYAINEGLNQELSFTEDKELDEDVQQKGPHAVFKELFYENQLDNYDQELMSNINSLQMHGVSMEDMLDEITQNDICEAGEEGLMEKHSAVKALNVKKAKEQLRAKKKAWREKRRAQKEVNMKNDLVALEKFGKQETFNKKLLTHLQLLCSLGMVKEGTHILQYYRARGNRAQEQEKVTDIRIYNTLLHGFASNGLYRSVEELLTHMKEDGIVMNPQTFAAIFECIERSQLHNKYDVLNIYYNMMTEKGITLNDLLDKSKFLYDQREVVLNAIRNIVPTFTPTYTPPKLDYDCPLLDGINLDNVCGSRDGLKHSPAEGLLTVEEMKQRAKKQFEIEMKGNINVQNIDVKEDVSDTVKFYRVKLQETEDDWRNVIREAFMRNLGTLKSQSSASHSPITLYPYLKVLDENQFVELIMGELSKLVDGSQSYSPALKVLQRELGTLVYNRYQVNQFSKNGVMKKKQEIYDKYCEWYINRQSLDGSDRLYNCRQAWQLLVHQNRDGASLDIEEEPWPMDIRQNIGKFLYNIIIHDVKINVNMFNQKNSKVKKVPAVYKVHRPWGRLVRLELKPHPVVCRLCMSGVRLTLRMSAPLVPPLSVSAPWAAHKTGAYLLTDTTLIRIPFTVVQQWKRLEEAPPQNLYPVLDSLNQLGEVPWVINKPILDLQLQVFKSGGSKKLDIPQPPSSLDVSQFAKADDKSGAFRRRVAINRARSEMYSLWCDGLYKLSLANHYRDEVFWLPHNMDFRGRAYACPPHLSQLGADNARALLRFANPKPLGPNGLQWLKLHAINLTGTMKKKTLNERLAYADSILDKIIESADNPLEGEMWWCESEEPWQTLATCMEIANAIRSPDPAAYLSGFPVHQDGSCNGLQHYAALGGDSAGAAAVNLAPMNAPQDVYSAVAALVEDMRAKDAAKGVMPAIALKDFVRRKVIKQTVMTTVYGVTKFGARLQIAKQLKDIDDFPKDQVWACSSYLTGKTFDSLREMFTSTKLIQDWFTDCAKAISGICGDSVEWVTPLGLPVVQPYYRRATVNSSPVDHHQRPCTVKQKNAFPPNFIHSLDSSHMMLTSIWCQAAGITFISVHDCFWTHPITVDAMNEICREQFVALHSQPILDDLSEFLTKKYSYNDSEINSNGNKNVACKKYVNELLKKVPSKGDFELKNVLKSIYFFS